MTINNLPLLYKNELIYSWMTRISKIYGFTSSADNNESLFDKKVVLHNVYYPIYLSKLVEKIPRKLEIDEKYIIENHSLLPLIKPFTSVDEYEKIIEQLSNGIPYLVAYKMGATKKTNHGNQLVKLCPQCLEEDRTSNHVLHLRREHQAPGVFVCPKHKVFLDIYEIPAYVQRSHLCDIEEIMKIKAYNYEQNIQKHFRLSKSISRILDGDMAALNISIVKYKYLNRLKEKGYYKVALMDRERLTDDFIYYHGEEWLNALKVHPNRVANRNWVDDISSDRRNAIYSNPIQHLLFIQFLFGEIDEFLQYNYEYKPFGSGPWPCLNKVADHYGQRLITEVNITRNNEKKNISGEFKCECGFTYRRYTDMNDDEDEYKYSAIIDFGHFWMEMLEKKIYEGKSISVIVDEMKTSHSSVLKYATLLGLKDKLNTKANYSITNKSSYKQTDLMTLRKLMFDKHIKNNPDTNRKDLKSKYKKEYRYIMDRDSKWMDTRLPKNKHKKDFSSYWLKLDNELHKEIKKAATKIKNYSKPIRITKNSISNAIGDIRVRQNKTLINLPKTNKALLEVLESKEKFNQRKERHKF